MKKFLRYAVLATAAIGVSIGLAWGGDFATVQARHLYPDVPEYLDGNTDFQKAFDLRDDSFYVDRSSVVIEKQQKPYYIIAAQVFQLNNVTGYTRTFTQTFCFDTKRGYLYYVHKGVVDFAHPMYTYEHTSEYALRALAEAHIMWEKAMGTEWNY